MSAGIPIGSVERASVPINFLWLAAGRLSADVCLFIFYVGLSRLFGDVGIGHYAFAMSFTGIFGYLADFGLYRYSLQAWPRRRDSFSTSLGEVLAVRILLIPTAFCVLFGTSLALQLDEQQLFVVVIVGLHQLLFTLANGWLAVFVANHQSHLSSVLDVAAKLLTVSLGLALMLAGADLPIVLTSMPAATICLIIVAAVTVRRRFGSAELVAGFRTLTRTARATLPSFLAAMGRQIAIRTDVVLLGLLAGAAETGIYSVGQRIVWMLMAIPALAAVAILPQASILYTTDRAKLVELYTHSINVTLLLGVPTTAGILLIADDVITLIFGIEFIAAVPILQILSVFLFLSAVRNVLGLFLTACEQEVSRARLEWSGAGLGLALQLVLIPLYGITGAAIAIVAMESLTTIAIGVLVAIKLGRPRVFHRFVMSLAGSLAFSVVWIWLDRPPLIITIPMAIAVYTAIMMTSRRIVREDLGMLMSVLAGK